MTFALHTPAFQDGGAIPAKYARDGENVSPPLRWSDPPTETRSFALLVEDTDASTKAFRHWAMHGIPPNQSELREGVGGDNAKSPQGVNDFGKTGYDGPEPPVGDTLHHYHFRIAALDVAQLDVPPDANAATIWQAANGHILAEAEVVGTYRR